jgi:hypothetical protein
MADIYEFWIPRSEKIFEGLSDSDAIEKELVEALTERVIVKLGNGEKSIQNRIADPKVIYDDRFLQLIQLHKRNTAVTKTRLESLFPPMDNLLELLDAELTNSKK